MLAGGSRYCHDAVLHIDIYIYYNPHIFQNSFLRKPDKIILTFI